MNCRQDAGAPRVALVSSPAFRRGARGFVVRPLQRALGLSGDGIYGAGTEAAVYAAQRKLGLQEDGAADVLLFTRLGLRWPDTFTRCLNVTNLFEGTGFGDANRTDIDGAGITWGIVGFTSKHGEVQRLLTQYLRANPNAVECLGLVLQRQLRELVRVPHVRGDWERVFYSERDAQGSARLNSDLAAALKVWGEDPQMQEMQLREAYTKYWVPAVTTAGTLRVQSMQGLGLLFDTHVQNGSWRADHQRVYDSLSRPGATEIERLGWMARAVAECAAPKWGKDVLNRKMVFVHGQGEVHGWKARLSAQGFEGIA